MAKKTVEPELGTVQVGIADFQRTRDSVSLFPVSRHGFPIALPTVLSTTTTRRPTIMGCTLVTHFYATLPQPYPRTTSSTPSSQYP